MTPESKAFSSCLVFGLLSSVVALYAPGPLPAIAQVQPDPSLGPSSSIVNFRDATSDRIDGGAARGANLFHSFREFNIAKNRGVYFANPSGIENILSRVTGGNPSQIDGTLGVLGPANLFFLNPNGIVFGPNATLDIPGSFYGSTAEAIALGEQGHFSALQPQRDRLVSISPSAFFFNQVSQAQSSIVNRGTLVAGEDLTLHAEQLDLQGQVEAGQTLILKTEETLKIRDTETTPFVALAGEDLLVEGENVDISALNHVESGVFSAGNLTLRSDNPVVGDAHYSTLGNFRVENLNENLSSLWSVVDPIIHARGDVNIGVYAGSSLHIIAGGSVTLGDAVINLSETGTLGVDFLQETVLLSNGMALLVDGGAQPTLDIRAGVDPSLITSPLLSGYNPPGDFLSGTANDVPTNADIVIGSISLSANSLTYLTNQYERNPEISGGDITLSGGFFPNALASLGGDIILDARDNIIVNDNISTSAPLNGNSGNITVLANSLLLNDGSVISTLNSGDAVGGEIDINVFETVALSGQRVIETRRGSEIQVSSINTGVKENAAGSSGSINIKTRDLGLNDGAVIQSTSTGKGASGAIQIEAGNISLDGTTSNQGGGSAITSSMDIDAVGTAGAIRITTDTLSLNSGARVSSSTFGNGNAGNIHIVARNQVNIKGGLVGPRSSILSEVNSKTENLTDSMGVSGNIKIEAKSLSLEDRGAISSTSIGKGNSGTIEIHVEDTLKLVNRAEISASAPQASAGDVTITATDIRLDADSNIRTNILFGEGGGGDITLKAGSIVAFADSDILAFSRDGSGGNITLDTPIFLGDSFAMSPSGTDPLTLDQNDQVDVNATGALSSGGINLPDVSFIQNSLTDLPENLVDTNTLLTRSCLVRPTAQQGKFLITGSAGLPTQPGDAYVIPFSTQDLPNPTQSAFNSRAGHHRPWQIGDPIIEAQGVYPLDNGELVVGRPCSTS